MVALGVKLILHPCPEAPRLRISGAGGAKYCRGQWPGFEQCRALCVIIDTGQGIGFVKSYLAAGIKKFTKKFIFFVYLS